MNSIELKQQRATLILDTKNWHEKANKDNNLSESEIEQEWCKRNAEIDRLDAEARKLEKSERLEHLSAGLNETSGRKTAPSVPGVKAQPTRQERNQAMKAWMGYGRGLKGINYGGDVLGRCAELGMSINDGTINIRSLNTSTGTAGGNTTFTTTSPDIVTELKYYSKILDKVKVELTADGNTFSVPKGSDVSNSMTIVNQQSASPLNQDPTFQSKVNFGGYTFRCVVQVTNEMLQDAVFDVESWLMNQLGQRAGRCLENYIVAGTGSSQPTGLVTAVIAADGGTPAVTLASGKKSFDSFDAQLYPLFQAVDLSYRDDNTLVLHDSSVWDLRKIKDSQGRYIWDVNNTLAQNKQPDSIAGYKYLVSNSIDASNAFSKNIAVFANLPLMMVRLVEGIQITRLNELYRANGMIGFEALLRFDCNYTGHAASIARAATPAS